MDPTRSAPDAHATVAPDCDALVEAGWNDHADRPAEVAQRLAAGLASIVTPADASGFARLVTHVYGEHLGRWTDGIALLESMRALAPCADAAAAAALRRNVATLRHAGGLPDASAGLSFDDRVAVLAAAAAALAGRSSFRAALATYAEALALADGGLAAGSPAARALAVGGNNIAAALEEHPARDRVETVGMVAAAEAGLRYWKLAGSWLEEERAEYRLTCSLLQADRPDGAVASAQRCIAVCERHDAPPVERFYAFEALARAWRAAGDDAAAADARARCSMVFDALPPDERQGCERVLRAL